ncbi:hypothetical protein F0402_20600, partial [Mycolicibacter arupensis]
MHTTLRPLALAGAAVIGAGAIAATPVVVAPTNVHMPAIELTADGSGLLDGVDFSGLFSGLGDLLSGLDLSGIIN